MKTLLLTLSLLALPQMVLAAECETLIVNHPDGPTLRCKMCDGRIVQCY